jgi:hypothetical protein
VTTITTHVKVGADGNVIVPVGRDEAGREVTVTITPAPGPTSQEEYQRIIRETAGSVPDLRRPPQGEYEKREPLE